MKTILTNAKGVPYSRPERADFATDLEFIRAYHAYKNAIRDAEAFDQAARKAFRKPRKT